jgi:hypothetical protein
LDLWNLRGRNTDFETLLPKIRNKIVERDYALIILDPIYKLYGNLDENKAGDIARLLNEVEDLATSTGAAVAFGAHFSKGNQSGKESLDRISGSGVFTRDPDSLLIFTRHEKDRAFTVEATLRNFKPMDPFVVRFDYPLMRRDDSLNPRHLKLPGNMTPRYSAAQLLDVLGNRQLATTEWLERAKAEIGISQGSFYRLYNDIKAKGMVQQNAQDQWYVPGKASPAAPESAADSSRPPVLAPAPKPDPTPTDDPWKMMGDEDCIFPGLEPPELDDPAVEEEGPILDEHGNPF